MSRLADNILDALTSGEHSKQLKETGTVRNLTTHSLLQVFGQNFPAHLIHNKCILWYIHLNSFQWGSLLKSALYHQFWF